MLTLCATLVKPNERMRFDLLIVSTFNDLRCRSVATYHREDLQTQGSSINDGDSLTDRIHNKAILQRVKLRYPGI